MVSPERSWWRLSATQTAAIIAFFIAAPQAAAQTPSSAPAAGYLFGGVLLATQGAGRSDCPYLCDPFGGTAWGLAVGAGVGVGTRLAVGAELSRSGALSGSQRLRTGGGTFLPETVHRDTIASLVLRFSPAAAGDSGALVLVGGGGVAFRQTSRTGQIVREFTGELIGPRVERLNDIVPAALGGLDVHIRLSRRSAVVPFVRAHYLFDSDRTGDGTVKRGVASFIFRAGVTLEIRF